MLFDSLQHNVVADHVGGRLLSCTRKTFETEILESRNTNDEDEGDEVTRVFTSRGSTSEVRARLENWKIIESPVIRPVMKMTTIDQVETGKHNERCGQVGDEIVIEFMQEFTLTIFVLTFDRIESSPSLVTFLHLVVPLEVPGKIADTTLFVDDEAEGRISTVGKKFASWNRFFHWIRMILDTIEKRDESFLPSGLLVEERTEGDVVLNVLRFTTHLVVELLDEILDDFVSILSEVVVDTSFRIFEVVGVVDELMTNFKDFIEIAVSRPTVGDHNRFISSKRVLL